MLNIAYAPDNKYVNQTIVSMQSIVDNHKNNKINFIIMYSSLEESNISKFNDFKSENVSITLIKQDELMYKSLPLSKWVTVQAWFRITLADFFPNLNKILYLDCDTLVRGNLLELFETDLSNKYFAGVKDVWGVEKHIKRLSMKSDVYCNSGVLLLNCDYCRENGFSHKIMYYAKNNASIIQFCDQDSINKVADNDKVVLHPKYNFMDTWWRGGYYEFDGNEEDDYLEAKENPVIVHLTGLKPVSKGCGNKFREEWWYYAKKTLIYDELLKEFNHSKLPKKSVKDFLFSIKNEYKGKIKTKVLTVIGIKIKLKKC